MEEHQNYFPRNRNNQPHQDEPLAGRTSPLLGHEPQCYYIDNRCHCASSEPFRLPPEQPFLPEEPPEYQESPLSVQLTPQEVVQLYKSIGGMYSSQQREQNSYCMEVPSQEQRLAEASASTSSGQCDGHIRECTERTGNSFYEYSRDDLPPSYESIYPQGQYKEGV